MERNRLKTINVNVGRPAVLFLDGLTIVFLAEWFQCMAVCVMDMEVQCHGRYQAW